MKTVGSACSPVTHLLFQKLTERKPPIRRVTLSTSDPEPSTTTASVSPVLSLSTTEVPTPTSTISASPDTFTVTTSLPLPATEVSAQISHSSSSSVNTSRSATASKMVATDHPYAMQQSPRRIKQKLHYLYDNLMASKKRYTVEHQRVRRLKKQVEDLNSVITSLKQKLLVSDSISTSLNTVSDDVPQAVVKRTRKVKTKQRRIQYSEKFKKKGRQRKTPSFKKSFDKSREEN